METEQERDSGGVCYTIQGDWKGLRVYLAGTRVDDNVQVQHADCFAHFAAKWTAWGDVTARASAQQVLTMVVKRTFKLVKNERLLRFFELAFGH